MKQFQTSPLQGKTQNQQLWLHAESWAHFPGLVHGFSGRLPSMHHSGAGAPCIPTFAGLAPHTLTQVHGNDIVHINGTARGPTKAEADGMFTTDAEVLLGILTADCVPILMVAPQQRIVIALHAGWRGTQKAICLRAVELCTKKWRLDPSQLWVALGPSISGCCYEVGYEVGDPLFQRWGDGEKEAWHVQGDGKGLLDLRAINKAQLTWAGIPDEQIQSVGPCTCCNRVEFTSYRREGPQSGRQISVIGWKPS